MGSSQIDPNSGSVRPDSDTSHLGATVRLPSELKAADCERADETRLPVEAPARFGKYEVLGEIARGGMGIVYKARQADLGRIVALKVLQLDAGIDGSASKQDNAKELIARFAREAQSAARLEHPNIIKIHEVGVEEGRHYFTMEYVEGGNLRDHLSRVEKQDAERGTSVHPGVAVKRVLGMMRSVCEAIHYAHDHGVIHRDIKPQNILVDAHGQPKVTDFGLAKSTDSQTHLTQTGAVMGTPSYMAPEQAYGHTREIDRRSDVFSLGAVLYEAVTGRTPFDGVTVIEIIHNLTTQEAPRPTFLNHRIHRDVETIVLKALEKEQDRRYQTAREMAEDIRRFLEGEPIKARPASWGYRTWKRVRRHWVAVAAITVAIAAVAVFGTYGALVGLARSRDKSEQEARDERRREAVAYCDRAQRQQGEEAIASCTQAILCDPTWPDAWLARARLYAHEGKAQMAIADFTSALARDPRLSIARVERARLLEEDLHDLGGALADWQAAMQLDPRDAEACAAAGRIFSEQGRDAEAIEALDKAVRLDPSARNYAARARASLRAGRLDDARSDFSEALQRDKGNAEALSGLGTCFRLGGNLEEAVRNHELAVHADGGCGRYRFELGEDLYAAKDYEAAVTRYREAVARDSGLAPAYARLAHIYVLLGDYDKAFVWAHEATTRDSKDAEACLDSGRALAEKGFDDLALNDFDRAIQLAPERGDTWLYRGRTLLQMRRFDDAVASLTSAIQRSRTLTEAYLVRARAYAELDKPSQALADTSTALRLAPDSAEAYVTRGWVHGKMRQEREAIEDFSLALAKDPECLEALIERARARVALGDPAAAVTDYSKAIQRLGKMPAESDASVFRERAAARLVVGDAKGAQEDVARAAGLSPRLTSDPDFMLLCGKVHSALLDWASAVEDFTQVIRVGRTSTAELHHLRGTAYLWLEKWELAEQDLKEALQLDPKRAEAQAELSFLYLRQELPDRAEAAAGTAIQMDSSDARAYYLRGQARGLLGKIDAAIADERQAITLCPRFPEALRSLGLLYLQQGKTKEAYDYLSHAIEQRPGYVIAYLDRGDVAQRLGRTTDAVADYTEAIRRAPEDAEPYLRRGRAWLALDRLDQAVEDLTACIRRSEGNAQALFARGKAYRALGFFDRALKDLDEAVRLEPRDAEGYLERGRVQIDRKQFDAAVNDLSVATSIAPDHAEAWEEHGRAQLGAGRGAQAIEDLTKALALSPKDTFAFYWRSKAKLESNDVEGAIDDAEAGLRIDGRGVRLHLARAAALDASAATDEAIEEYKKAVTLDEKSVEAHRELADALARAKREREAVDQLSRAVELSQADPDLRVMRGNLYFRMSMTKEAIDDYTVALKLDPRHVTALANRAWVYEHETEYEKAAADLERLLTVEPNHPQAERLQKEMEEAQRRVKILKEGPRSPEEFYVRGDILLRRRELDASTADFERFLAGCGSPPVKGLEQKYVAAHYNLAAYYSVRKKADAAFDHLAKAIEGGFDDMERLRTDRDMEELRKDPRFQELLHPRGPNDPNQPR